MRENFLARLIPGVLQLCFHACSVGVVLGRHVTCHIRDGTFHRGIDELLLGLVALAFGHFSTMVHCQSNDLGARHQGPWRWSSRRRCGGSRAVCSRTGLALSRMRRLGRVDPRDSLRVRELQREGVLPSFVPRGTHSCIDCGILLGESLHRQKKLISEGGGKRGKKVRTGNTTASWYASMVGRRDRAAGADAEGSQQQPNYVEVHSGV